MVGRKWFLGLGSASSLAVVWLWLAGVSISREISPSSISPDSGHAYITPFPVSFPWRAETDHEGANTASVLVLYENGRALGPVHVPHVEIRQQGQGRSSHWNQAIWFSASDSSDPRSNGRRYEAETRMYLDGRLGAGLAVLFLIPAVIGVVLRPRVREGVRSGGLVLGSVVLCLGLMEGGLRLTDGASWLKGEPSANPWSRNAPGLRSDTPPPPRLLSETGAERLRARQGHLTMPEEWKRREVDQPPPGATHAYVWHGVRHAFDAQSMRPPRPKPEKAPGTLRVLVFGDSLTYGQGVEEEDTYPALLQRALSADYHVEVVNLGVMGHQSEDVLKEMRRFVPELGGDLVLYGICHNDFLASKEKSEAVRWRLAFPISSTWEIWLKAHFRLVELVSDAYDRLLLSLHIRGDFYDVILGGHGGDQARFGRDVAEMNRLVTAQGLPPVIAMVMDQWPDFDPRGRKITEIAETLTAQAGMAVIGTTKYYQEYGGRYLAVSSWDGHPNEEAHAIFAEMLYQTLIRRSELAPFRKNAAVVR